MIDYTQSGFNSFLIREREEKTKLSSSDIEALLEDASIDDRKIQGTMIDGANQRICLSDKTGTPRILLDGNKGIIKVSRAGYNVTTTPDENLLLSSDFPLAKEQQMCVTVQQRWTDTNQWDYRPDYGKPYWMRETQFKLDSDDWKVMKVYFEAVITSGPGYTCEACIYDDLADAPLAGSVISTTATDATTAGATRSSEVTLNSGERAYWVSLREQGRPSESGYYVNCYIARIVFRRD